MTTKKAKTIKIRIAVAVDDSGNWGAAGWKGAKESGDDSSMDVARQNAEAEDGLSGAEQHYYVTVEIALPRAIELTGAVIESSEFVEEVVADAEVSPMRS